MADKKDTTKTETGTDKTEKKVGAPSGGYPKKHQLTKSEVLEIINGMEKNRKKPETIAKKYGCSQSSVEKLFNILRNGEWKPAKENDKLPKGYMMPCNLGEVIDSVMYDLGYIREYSGEKK